MHLETQRNYFRHSLCASRKLLFQASHATLAALLKELVFEHKETDKRETDPQNQGGTAREPLWSLSPSAEVAN